MYGYDIDCTAGAQKIAVSAPYKDAGIVYVFQRNDTTFNVIEVFDAHTMNTGIIPNTVNSNVYLNDFDYFGFSIAITDRSLFVSAPNNDNKGFNVGSVFLFSNITGSIPYQLEQFILPPIINSNDRFGTKLSINPSNNLLAVSAIGGDSIIPLTFDNYSDRVASEEIIITGIAGTISSTNLITGLSDTSKLKLFTGMILTKTSGNGNFGGIVKIKTIETTTQNHHWFIIFMLLYKGINLQLIPVELFVFLFIHLFLTACFFFRINFAVCRKKVQIKQTN